MTGAKSQFRSGSAGHSMEKHSPHHSRLVRQSFLKKRINKEYLFVGLYFISSVNLLNKLFAFP